MKEIFRIFANNILLFLKRTIDFSYSNPFIT